jgi:hypothetical protein
MANKNPNISNLKMFKKGQSGNPKGRTKQTISTIIEQLENEGVPVPTKKEIVKVYLMLINCSIDKITEMVSDDTSPALVRIVGKAVLSGKGFEIIEKMLDRAIGKPENSMDVKTNGETLNSRPIIIFGDDETKQ